MALPKKLIDEFRNSDIPDSHFPQILLFIKPRHQKRYNELVQDCIRAGVFAVATNENELAEQLEALLRSDARV